MRNIFNPNTGHDACLSGMGRAMHHLQWATHYATTNIDRSLLEMRLALQALNAGRGIEDPCPHCHGRRVRHWEETQGHCLWCHAPVLPEIVHADPTEAERERQAAIDRESAMEPQS